jgi:CheY-like chemotaxis protein
MDFAPLQTTDVSRKSAKGLTRVLIIDDDDSVSAAISAILAGRRYETAIAPRAYAGIHALRNSSFDVVMIDIFMPGLNGLDAIKHIRRESSIPIIAMSGFQLRRATDAGDYLDLAVQRGASLCMRKPFQPAQLVGAIDWTRRLGYLTEGLQR